jgi:hypothetical protein
MQFLVRCVCVCVFVFVCVCVCVCRVICWYIHLIFNMHGKNIKVIVSRNLLHVATGAIFLISNTYCAMFVIVSKHPLQIVIECVQRWSTMAVRYDLLIMSLFWCMCSFCIDRNEERPPNFLPYDEIGIPCSISSISVKQWAALFSLLVFYIMIGAVFYYILEGNLDTVNRLQEYNEGLELQGEFINKCK